MRATLVITLALTVAMALFLAWVFATAVTDARAERRRDERAARIYRDTPSNVRVVPRGAPHDDGTHLTR